MEKDNSYKIHEENAKRERESRFIMKEFNAIVGMILVILICSVLIMFSIDNSSAVKADSNPAVSTIEHAEAKIRAAFPASTIHSVATSEIPGVYELRLGRNWAYTGIEGRYLLIGHIIDTTTGADLTQQRIDAVEVKKIDAGAVEMPQPVLQLGQPGADGEALHVWLDTDCPYCQRLLGELRPLVEETRQDVRIYLLPLHGPRSHARALSVLCATGPERQLERVLAKPDDPGISAAVPACEAGKQRLDAMAALAEKLGIRGTPAYIRAGKISYGFRNAQQLLTWLKAAKAPA